MGDASLGDVLGHVVSESATAAMQCLAAAERAVLDGRFNLAKVLRACAHAERLAALTAARLLAHEAPPTEVVARSLTLLQRQARDKEAVKPLAAEHHAPDVLRRFFDARPAAALEDVLRRALASLDGNRDVLESDVAQSLWGCQVCGAVAEGRLPEGCADCGALSFEFEWFGPFYSGTVERLGRRSPTEIAHILRESPWRLAHLWAGIAEERLARRPSADEWCIKEIAGHLVDVTELFSWRVGTIRDAAAPPALDGTLPPWRMLEGKRYPEIASALIAESLRRTTQEALEVVEGLGAEDWGRFGLMRGRVTTVLDLGTWLANHNLAHFAQIEALRESAREV